MNMISSLLALIKEWGVLMIIVVLMTVAGFVIVSTVRRSARARLARAEASAARSRKWAEERAAKYASPEYIATLKPAVPRVVASVPVVRQKRRFSESKPFYSNGFDSGRLYGTRYGRSSWF